MYFLKTRNTKFEMNLGMLNLGKSETTFWKKHLILITQRKKYFASDLYEKKNKKKINYIFKS